MVWASGAGLGFEDVLGSGDTIIVSTDDVSEAFSIWGWPHKDAMHFRSDDRFKDELRVVKACVESAK